MHHEPRRTYLETVSGLGKISVNTGSKPLRTCILLTNRVAISFGLRKWNSADQLRRVLLHFPSAESPNYIPLGPCYACSSRIIASALPAWTLGVEFHNWWQPSSLCFIVSPYYVRLFLFSSSSYRGLFFWRKNARQSPPRRELPAPGLPSAHASCQSRSMGT